MRGEGGVGKRGGVGGRSEGSGAKGEGGEGRGGGVRRLVKRHLTLSPPSANLHEQQTSNERTSLAVANFSVVHRICLNSKKEHGIKILCFIKTMDNASQWQCHRHLKDIEERLLPQAVPLLKERVLGEGASQVALDLPLKR